MIMESKHRGIDGINSPRFPQSSNYTYFSEQARRAGHTRSEIRRTQPEHLHPRPAHHLHPHPLHIPLPGPYLAPQPHDMHEAIQREIEKERIREEIIISEIARRRVLEAEVRRELMMERELALGRERDGFPFGSSSVMGLESPIRLSLLGTRAEMRSVEDRIASAVKETERLSGRFDAGGLETLPFQRGTAPVRISEVKPVAEGSKDKEKIILLAKPGINISGSKRKAITPRGVDASELLSDNISKKKAKEEWSCALCQVSTTSEQGLEEHVRGKKHKSKEAALRAQKYGKNYSIGLFPKKATKSIQVVKTVVPDVEDVVKIGDESLPFKGTGETSSKEDDLLPLWENPNSDKLKKNQPEIVQKEGKNVDLKKEQFTHWCEICQVGTFSSKVMNSHKRGKKHISRLGKNDQRGMAGQYNQKEKVKVVAYHAEDEKNTSENVDKHLDEVSSDDPRFKNALKTEDRGLLDETNVEVGGELDETEPEPIDETKPEPLDDTKSEGGDVDVAKPGEVGHRCF